MTATAATTAFPDRALPPARLTHRLGLWFAHAYVLGMCATVGGAYVFQFALGEHPCPMCLLQRMFMLLSALGPAMIIARSRKGAVGTAEFASGWGVAVASALIGSTVSASQVLMHVVPPDPGYAGALFGLHLYTWAAIVFLAAVLSAAVNLVLAREFQPLGSAQATPALRRAAGLTLTVLAFFAVSNLVACLFLQGLHWQMPGAPTAYRLITDLR
ncbi:disulfide bond formation protein B [Streptomyces polychromogenes]|uniref:Disulfide bond formation protein B n=1 Tax=Streptomyces polychromogenes TaxID=67342 RepID=A0ABP3F472_9ACTN